MGMCKTGHKNESSYRQYDQSKKLQKMVAMEITANLFDEFGNQRVYEDVQSVLVNRGDNLDLNDRNLRTLCALTQHVPHDVDKTNVGFPHFL